MQETQVPFEIEFFIIAIESDSYDIAFYLLKQYEDKIFQEYQAAVDTHVKSYRVNRTFLRSKLHMTKMLLDVFSFNSTKNFLEIIQDTLYDPSVDGNIFTHTRNPLLCMCLLYEILT